MAELPVVFTLDLAKADEAEGNPPGRPPTNVPKDAGSHQIAGSGQRIVANPGRFGGTWYRDKNGFVQYGVLQPGGADRYGQRAGAPKPPSGSAPSSGATFRPSQPLIFTLYNDVYALTSYADVARFGSLAIPELQAMLTPEQVGNLTLGNPGGAVPAGAKLFSALLTNELERPDDSVGDLYEIMTAAERLEVPVEDVFRLALASAYEDENGNLPDNYDQLVQAHMNNFTAAYDKLKSRRVVSLVAQQQQDMAEAVDDMAMRRFAEAAPLLSGPLAETMFSGNDPHLAVMQLLLMGRTLGLVQINKTPHELHHKIDPATGIPYSIAEQMSRAGEVEIFSGPLPGYIRYLTNLASTEQGDPAIAGALAVLARYAAFRAAQVTKAAGPGRDADLAVASFTKPDGSPKEDFVFSFDPGSAQFEEWQKDPEGFWSKAPNLWKRDVVGLMSQDKGLEVLFGKHLLHLPEERRTPEVLREYIKQINKTGAAFAEAMDDYINVRTDRFNYHLVEAFVSGSLTREQAATAESLEAALSKVREHAANVAASLKARRAKTAEIEVPPVIAEHLRKTGMSPLSWQLIAAHWMVAQKRGVLALDAGLGKTGAAILYSEMLFQKKLAKKVIIFVPKQGIDQFPRELRDKWLGPSARKIRVLSPSADSGTFGLSREDLLTGFRAVASDLDDAEYVFAGTSLLRGSEELQQRMRDRQLAVWDEKTNAFERNPNISPEEWRREMRILIKDDPMVQALKSIDAPMIIDECHDSAVGLRNPDNLGYMILEEINEGRERVFGMSATPAPNKTEDLINILNNLAPGQVPASVYQTVGKLGVPVSIPELDADGNTTGNYTRYLANGEVFHRAAEELKHVLFYRSLEDPFVQQEFSAKGLRPPGADVSRVRVPVNPRHQKYIDLAMEGHDDYARLELADARNARRIAGYRARLARNINPDYANPQLYPDEALWGLRELSQRVVDDAGNPVYNADGTPVIHVVHVSQVRAAFKPPRKDVVLTWDEVKNDPQKAALYRARLVDKVTQSVRGVWGSRTPVEDDFVSSKVEALVDLVRKHFNHPVDGDKAVHVTVENVSILPLIRDRLVKEGFPRSVIAELRGDGDTAIADRRAAMDRDAMARMTNSGEFKVLLSGPSGGIGLNLQNVGMQIRLQEPYTHGGALQVAKRVVRVGQESIPKIVILTNNYERDFKRSRRSYERTLAVIPLTFQTDEQLDQVQLQEARIAHLGRIIKAVHGVDLPIITDFDTDDEGRIKLDDKEQLYPEEFGPLPTPEAIAEYAEQLGIADAPLTDSSRFDEAMRDSRYFQRLPAYATVMAERHLSTNKDVIGQSRVINKMALEMGAADREHYEDRLARLNREEDGWRAAIAGMSETVYRPVNVSVAPQHGFRLAVAFNPFTQSVVEAPNQRDRLALQQTTLRDSPRASTLPGATAGYGDAFINYNLWEAIRKNGIRSAPELIDGVLRPLTEAAGIWSPGMRNLWIKKVESLLLQWHKAGYIHWTGEAPDDPGLSAEERFTVPSYVPHLSAVDPVEAILLEVKQMSPRELAGRMAEPAVATAAKLLGIDPKPAETYTLTPDAPHLQPAFTDLRMIVNGETVTVDAAALGSIWSSVREHLADGKPMRDAADLYRLLGGVAPSNRGEQNAARRVLGEFERLGLIAPSQRPAPAVQLLPKARVGYIPEFGDIPVKDGTDFIRAQELEDAWASVVHYIASGERIDTTEKLLEATGLEEADLWKAEEIITEFFRQRLIKMGY